MTTSVPNLALEQDVYMFPTSFAQQGIWLHEQLVPDSTAYNLFYAVRINSPLNVTAFEQSLNAIIERHEVLRTTFVAEDGQPMQVIIPHLNLPLLVVDLQQLPETAREAETLRLANEQVQLPFDLGQGPLLRTTLLQLGTQEYILLLTIHHIIFDEWSAGVFFRELADLYSAIAADQMVALPELPIQYADFAVWQREWLQDAPLEDQVAYWKEQLAAAPTALELPTNQPRPAVPTGKGSLYLFSFSRHLAEALKNLSREEGVSLFTIMIATFSTLLSRYTGQEDLLVGTVTADRGQVETEDLIGFFINTLVLRTDLSGNPTFRELLVRVHKVVLEAIGHGDVPFEYLLKELHPHRSSVHNPFFQVRLALQPPAPLLPSGWELIPLEITTGAAPYDLDLEIYDRPDGLLAYLQYNTDLFDQTSIARLVDHWQRALEGIVADGNCRIADLPLLSDAEWHQQVVEWNATEADYPEHQCFHELFEAQVERTPHMIAVVCEQEQLTYSELNNNANALARYLQGLGVGPESLVAILAERSTTFLITMLAIFKAGGAYLPLDPRHPPERLRNIVELSSSRLVLATKEFAPLLSQALKDIPTETGLQVIYLEDLQFSNGKTEENLPVSANPRNLAYVIYTSGSTGMPKGAMIEQRGMINHLYAKISALQLTAADTVAQTASQCFDISVWQFLVALLIGGCVHIFKDEISHDPMQLLTEVERQQITILETVPSLLRVMLDSVESGSSISPHLEKLRWLVPTGEALPPEFCDRWLAMYPRVPLLNAYGPTECSDDVTHFPIYQPLADSLVHTPIGRPINNMRMYILDRKMRPLPVGVSGELYVGGVGVGRGYLNDPRRTAEAFVADPFSHEPGARLYKTGDLARYLSDGNIEFLGRIDHQVKLRGYRIELGEIEAVLREHPHVQDVVVIAREDTPGNKYLAAYLVASSGVTGHDLRHYLQEKLPDYMVPASFVLLEELPLTPNGKVDRRALPLPGDNQIEMARNFVAPRTPVEEKLADIWASVLGLERVGIHDNFFELGGDSILSIQIIARTHRAGLPLTPKHLFQYQTIAQLAAVVPHAQPVAVQQGAVSGNVPLTPIQRWFFEQQFVVPNHWNQAWFLEVNQAVDVALLEQAVQQVLAHHDTFRLRFKQGRDGWQQWYAEHERIEVFRQVDLSQLSSGEQHLALERMAAEAQASLNLETGLLLRFVYFELGSDQPARLLIVIHHLIVDGVSWHILLEDLEGAYQDLSEDRATHLPPKTASFQEWSKHLIDYSQSAALHQELPYWLHRTSTSSSLPVDYTDGLENRTMDSARTVDVTLSAGETQALLHTVHKAYHTQINDVLLTALVQAFARWTGDHTLLVDLEGHGREPLDEDINLSRTIGWFTSIFPVCLALQSTSPAEALKAVKEQLRNVPNHGIGYSILRYMGGQEDIERLKALPEAQVCFNYLGQFDQTISGATLFKQAQESAGPTCDPKETQSYLLEINGLVIDGCLQLSWLFNERVHQPGTIERLVEYYLEALSTLIAHCQSPEAGGYTPSDFPLARLNQHELDTLVSSLSEYQEPASVTSHRSIQNLEDIYPLSPLQQGILFHSLYAPGSGVYIIPFHCVLQGDLDVPAFKRAWQRVVDRHAIFRTSFVWEDLREPLQVVQQHATLSWMEQDWRGLPQGEQDARVTEYLREDRVRDFDLSHAPLMRISLSRIAENRYYFTWSSHHLLLDGWSWSLVFKDALAYYEAFQQGQELHLLPAPSYRGYIAWLQQQNQEQAESYWREALQGFTAPTVLPFDQASGRLLPTQAEMYREQHVELSEATTAALQTLASQQQLTLNTLLQGVWAILLSRYSDERDVLFGATTSGRPAALPQVEFLVGPCINTLPVRAKISSDALLLPWLKELQVQQAEARQYDYSSLVQIQGWSEVPHTLPLFETLLVFENYPIALSSQQKMGEIELSDIPSIEQTNYPLTLTVMPGRELLIEIGYDCSRFEPDTVTRIVGHLKTILESIVGNPEQRIDELPLLTSAELQLVLVDWNATQMAYPQQQSLSELFEAQVERAPEAVALVYQGQRLTYCELNQRANQLAHHLQQMGVGAEERVGLCVERSLDMVVGLLGILKAGGAYVPLDPAYPIDRLAFMLQDAEPLVLLTQHSLLQRLPPFERVLCLDRDWQVIAQQSQQNLENSITGEQLAYLLYTSGSTGTPKGVLGTHRATINRCSWMWNTFPFESEEMCCQKTALSFVDAVWEVFGPLLQGIPSVIIPDLVVKDPRQLLSNLAAHGVTRLVLVPSLLRVLLDTLDRRPDLLAQLSRLKYWISSGEALPLELAQHFFKHMPSSVLLNLYGSSEVAADVTYYEMRKTSTNLASIPIGRPIANTQIYLLDQHLQLVPIGIPGEIYVGGDGLARGYFRRPELTANRFVPDPFAKQFGARLYKTGDQARYLPDGNLEYLGRLDQQVKLRGYRIELGEIEATLKEHPAVREALVVAREDKPGDQRLVAYIVAAQEEGAIIETLRDYLKEKLPNYMIPSVLLLLDALPLTPNGKVDRRALPAPELTRPELEVFVAPRTPLEQIIADIWGQVLGIEQVSIHDNFFALGGHSLLAMQIIALLHSSTQVELPLRSFFETPTVAQLAELVSQLQASGTESDIPTLRSFSRDRHRMSLAQNNNNGDSTNVMERVGKE